MPKTKSAAKRIKTSEKRRKRNQRVKSTMRTAIRNFENSLENGSEEEMSEALRKAVSCIDRAVSKGVLHRNTADRRKSKLHRRFNQHTGEDQQEEN